MNEDIFDDDDAIYGILSEQIKRAELGPLCIPDGCSEEQFERVLKHVSRDVVMES